MKKGPIHINTAAHGPRGSALILVIVLTVLLAAVGVLFLMTSRIDEMASSGIVRTRELRAGVNVVLDRIRTVLTDDLFGGDDFFLDGSGTDEYWDYPGDDDPWLASLEPIYDPCNTYFEWLHITDLYGHISAISDYYEVADPCYPVSSGAVTRIIADNEPVGYVVDDPGNPTITYPWGTRADADGDGVADSRWIALPDITSSEGENIYAAVRIIDNCGMININTAYRDPTNLTTQPGDWDGSLLSHVNLEGIISSTDAGNGLDATDIQYERFGDMLLLFPGYDPYHYLYDIIYEYAVSRRLLNPAPGCLPFDIGDELELRNRYFLSTSHENYPGVIPRCSLAWPVTFNPGSPVGRRVPFGLRSTDTIDIWFDHVKPDIDEPGWTSPDPVIGNYNRRILSTTYSFDRVIAPWADTNNMPGSLQTAWYSWTDWNDPDSDIWSYRPVYVNESDLNLIAAAIWLGLPEDPDPCAFPQFQFTVPEPSWTDSEIRERLACQLAVNLIDAIDADPNVTEFNPTGSSDYYYGYESGAEQLYISMVAVAQYDNGIDPCEIHYAIELYNPGSVEVYLGNWSLIIGGVSFTLSGTTIPAKDSFLITDEDDATRGFPEDDQDDPFFSFAAGDSIELRWVGPGTPYTNDIIYQIGNFPLHSGAGELEKYPLYRGQNVLDEANSNLPIWPNPLVLDWPTPAVPVLGTDDLDEFLSLPTLTMMSAPIQMTVADNSLRTLGEFTNVLALGTMDVGGTLYTMPQFWENIRTSDGGDITNITAGRIDLQDSGFADIFRYLTLFNPFNDGVDNDGNGFWDEPEELAVAGRININTAPWFVIAQLPWVQDPSLPESNALEREAKLRLARAIVAYRDGLNLPIDYSGGRQTGMGSGAPAVREELGFANIAELINVTNDYDGSGGTYDLYSDIQKYGRDILGSSVPLDFTTDLIENDLEERDILFHRISNLVTVRSDVFTAYILVRIGQNGPQKRMIAVFDRSRVFSPADRPRLVVLHPVPDPR